MNCKAGDLAMVVSGEMHSASGKYMNHGKVVTCIRLMPFSLQFGANVWLVDTPLWWGNMYNEPEQHPYARDAYLMPINPLDDETADTDASLTA